MEVHTSTSAATNWESIQWETRRAAWGGHPRVLGQTILGSWFLSFRASFRLGEIQNKGGASIVVTDPPQNHQMRSKLTSATTRPPLYPRVLRGPWNRWTSPHRGTSFTGLTKKNPTNVRGVTRHVGERFGQSTAPIAICLSPCCKTRR